MMKPHEAFALFPLGSLIRIDPNCVPNGIGIVVGMSALSFLVQRKDGATFQVWLDGRTVDVHSFNMKIVSGTSEKSPKESVR